MASLDTIDLKRNALLQLSISPEDKRRLEKKFRLEWSFHSNHIEGNTLTYGETEMLLFFGKALGDHEKREFDEVEAHDVAVKLVEDWARDISRNITEVDIRLLNKIILVKPFWKEAITPDGQPTRKEIIPGSYKTMPNSVRLKNGEIHQYTSPEETPRLMGDLLQRYVEAEKSGQHPVIIATWFHHRFVAIHPFDDGNGRVARLLTNFILIRHNYPPVIIKTENKEEYLTTLQKADVGDLEPLANLLIKELEWSLDKSIDAANGGSIEELNDFDKEVALLKARLNRKEDLIERSIHTIDNAWFNSIFPLIQAMDRKTSQFDELFQRNEIEITLFRQVFTWERKKFWTEVPMWVDSQFHNPDYKEKPLNNMTIVFLWSGFKGDGDNIFDVSSRAEITFDQYNWTLNLPFALNRKYTRRYRYTYSKEDIDDLVNVFARNILDQIKTKTNNWD